MSERWYPSFWGVVVAATAGGLQWVLPAKAIPKDLGQLFASTLDIGAISIGFLATAKTVLLSIQGSKAMVQMRGTGLYKGLLRFILKAIQVSFALAAFSLACIPLEKALQDTVAWRFIVTVWLGLVITSGLACYRVIDVFFTILQPKDVSSLSARDAGDEKKPLKIVVPSRQDPEDESDSR